MGPHHDATPRPDHPESTPETTAHERSGPPILGDVRTFPSSAELARTLVGDGAVAAIATITSDGFPYTSIAPISVDEAGAPVICVSELAEHTQNLRRSGRASALVSAPEVTGADPLALPRAALIGAFQPIDPDRGTVDRHLAVHPHAADYVGFADFGWWRMRVSHVRYVGGFGVMGWASGPELAAALVDPIIPVAGPMIDHLNADHADACLLIVRHLGHADGATSAEVTGLDRYGMSFAAHGPFGDYEEATVRVAFPNPLRSPDDVRAATVELVRIARSHNANDEEI